MPDLRTSKLWDPQIENDLPDSRLKYDNRKTIRFRGLEWNAVYCASCGDPHGMSTVHTPHVFYVCDKCVGRDGPPPGCKELSIREL